MMPLDPALALTLRLLLAAVLAAGGDAKRAQPLAFAGVVANYRLLPSALVTPFAFLLPPAGLATAPGLLLPAARPAAAVGRLFGAAPIALKGAP